MKWQDWLIRETQFWGYCSVQSQTLPGRSWFWSATTCVAFGILVPILVESAANTNRHNIDTIFQMLLEKKLTCEILEYTLFSWQVRIWRWGCCSFSPVLCSESTLTQETSKKHQNALSWCFAICHAVRIPNFGLPLLQALGAIERFTLYRRLSARGHIIIYLLKDLRREYW